MKRALLILLGLACTAALFGAESTASAKKPDPWEPVRFLLGKWEGESEGEPGTGKSVREYAFTLNSKFIEVRNQSTYPPQEKNPKGEIHEDRSFMSYDRAAKKLVLRMFTVEGFVNHYVLDSVSADGRVIVFTTVAIENIPAGFRARETYTKISDDEFTELFEIAEPGKDFEKYSGAHFLRAKP
jgi:hypothetical protein